MREYFDNEIAELKTSLIKMASIVDAQVGKVFNSLEFGDVTYIRDIKEKDLEIDAYDELLQAKCESILAIFQPVASDLRFVLSVLMINNQLERCGDIAVNISNRMKKTIDYHDLILSSHIPEMGRQAKLMIGKSIDAFINCDTDVAKKVIASDVSVDHLNKQSFTYLVTKMQEDTMLIESCAHLLIMTRNIERLADHATNIAEDVLFQIDAKIYSHKKSKEYEDDLAKLNLT